MLSNCTQPIVLAMCPVVTGCDHMRLVATVDYRSQGKVLYERCTPEKKTQIHWQAGVVASQLLNDDQYVRKYWYL